MASSAGEVDQIPMASSNRLKVSDNNLAILQEYLRKDPESYQSEFVDRFQHFLQLMKLLDLDPDVHRSVANSIVELVNFLASVAYCYPDEGKKFGLTIQETLANRALGLSPDLRLTFSKALVTLVNRQMLELSKVIQLFFDLLVCDDKNLRKFVLGAVISFVKELCRSKKSWKKRRAKIRRSDTFISQIQTFVYSQLKSSNTICAKTAQQVLVEAYQKRYWRDSKTANTLAECIFHPVPRIQINALRFFLGSSKDEEGLDDESSDDETDQQKKNDPSTLKQVQMAFKHAKKTRKRARQVEKVKKNVNQEKRHKKEQAKFCNLEAIRDIYDPQKFADRLFGKLEERRNEKYALRLLQMALCARVIGIHRLQTLGFYSYLQRYLQPKQKDVTRILLYAAQACHPLIPADIVEGLVRAIAQNFITDWNTAEAMTVGLNTIREIYASCPDAATEEMVRDLVQYKSYRNKNVSMAARGLINLFRALNPKILHHKDRGRPIDIKKKTSSNNEVNSEENDSEDEEEFSESENDDEMESIDADLGSSEEEIDEEECQNASNVVKTKEADIEMEGVNSGDDDDDDEEEEPDKMDGLIQRSEVDGLPRLNAIEHFHKKIQRQTKQERLEQIRQGREGRPDYGKPKKKGPHVGRTNRELAKRKNFQMVKQKVRGKNRQRSFRDRQLSLRKYLLKQSGRKIV